MTGARIRKRVHVAEMLYRLLPAASATPPRASSGSPWPSWARSSWSWGSPRSGRPGRRPSPPSAPLSSPHRQARVRWSRLRPQGAPSSWTRFVRARRWSPPGAMGPGCHHWLGPIYAPWILPLGAPLQPDSRDGARLANRPRLIAVPAHFVFLGNRLAVRRARRIGGKPTATAQPAGPNTAMSRRPGCSRSTASSWAPGSTRDASARSATAGRSTSSGLRPPGRERAWAG
jgi:hypothetical protein